MKHKQVFGAWRPATRIICTALLSFLLSACSAMDGKPVPSLTFQHLPVLNVDVGEINFLDQYDASLDPLSVRGAFPETPEDVIARYVTSRLEASGIGGRLDVILEEASVRQRLEESESDLQKLFWIGRSDAFDVVIKLRLAEYAPSGDQVTGSVLTFQRSLMVPQIWSVAERERAQMEALELLVADIDAGLRKSLDKTFGLL